MIQNGVRPVRPDNRDLSHTATFGATTPSTFPDSFDTDNGISNPNQNADGRPNSCRAYTQSEICWDEDKQEYTVQFTDDKQCLIEGIPTGSPGDIRVSLKSTIVYGVQEPSENSDMQAFQHRRGSYYQIEKAPDYFDACRSALIKSGSVSMATPWYDNFSNPDSNGIVTLPTPNEEYSYHNYKVCGWKTIAGTPYIKIKAWTGRFYWFPREVINFLLDQTYTGAFVLERFVPNAPTITILTTYEVILGYLHRILAVLQLKG